MAVRQSGRRIVVSEQERVLVVPSGELDRLGRFQGFSPEAERYLRALLIPKLVEYRPRWQVEEDPGFKQIIPYVVFRCEDHVFCYRRGKSQGEARLHRLRSLGVGGHISEDDARGGKDLDAYDAAIARELEEEVDVASPGRLARVGLINDDSTPVGRVHLGVVHVFELERPQVAAREEGLAEAEFLSLVTIGALRHEFETWSQICIDSFLSGR
jgi:predicted NUDIX family phosphoesterase